MSLIVLLERDSTQLFTSNKIKIYMKKYYLIINITFIPYYLSLKLIFSISNICHFSKSNKVLNNIFFTYTSILLESNAFLKYFIKTINDNQKII